MNFLFVWFPFIFVCWGWGMMLLLGLKRNLGESKKDKLTSVANMSDDLISVVNFDQAVIGN